MLLQITQNPALVNVQKAILENQPTYSVESDTMAGTVISTEPPFDPNQSSIMEHNGWLITGHGKITRQAGYACKVCNFYSEEIISECPVCKATRFKRVGCGTHYAVYWSGEHNFKFISNNCHLQACPRCHSAWIARLAETESAFITLLQQRMRTGIYHAVVSISEDLAREWEGQHPEKFWERFAKELNKIYQVDVRKNRPAGYCYVFHPYRLKCLFCGESYDKHKREDDSHQALRCCPKCRGPWVWRWGPHAHVIHDMYNTPESVRRFNEKTGMVFHNITKITGREHLFRTVKYELGHALMREKRRAIVMRGSFSGANYVRQLETLEKVVERDSHDRPYRKVEFKHQLGFCGRQCVLVIRQDGQYVLGEELMTSPRNLRIRPRRLWNGRRWVPIENNWYEATYLKKNPQLGLEVGVQL
ncbi:MAG: hypothetical protein H7836_15785 [Magnetococcus sp. YQC-3]